ncbi:MAG: hypothetical protein D4R88_04580 [Methanosarcinales archaeon]|nr:MAG: hypothetical protein D4R88_04580 [Methanosarcinales archaeon]
MNKVNFLLLVFSLFVLGGCAAPQVRLTAGAEVVRVAKADPPDNYEDIGPVSGFDGEGCGGFGYLGTYERAITNIKNRAYSLGADYVQIFTITEPHYRPNCFDNEYKLSGTAYKKVRDLPSPTPIINKSPNDNALEKLRTLKQMKDEGLITEQEYQE